MHGRRKGAVNEWIRISDKEARRSIFIVGICLDKLKAPARFNHASRNSSRVGVAPSYREIDDF